MKYPSFVATLLTGIPLALVGTVPTNATPLTININSNVNCFPGLGFTMPSKIPSSLDNWWCPYDQEYAFVGFSYEITACRSISIAHFHSS